MQSVQVWNVIVFNINVHCSLLIEHDKWSYYFCKLLQVRNKLLCIITISDALKLLLDFSGFNK